VAPRKTNRPGRSTRYYRKNAEARAKKAAYDKQYHSTPERRKYRSELNQERRKRGIYGKGGPDISHKADGRTTTESPKKNRGRQGSGGRPKRKR
jgi:hypothetical protein